MEIKTQMESVLAKLMGLEGPQPNKKLQYGHQRVLSKRYLQKNALICQRRKRPLDRFSEDMVDEMVDKSDSDEGLLYSSTSDKTPLERYEKESGKIFQKFRLLDSALQDETNGYLLRRFNCPNEKECVVSKKPIERLLHLTEKIPSGVRRTDRDFKTHGCMVRHGVAKQVAKELQQSLWHNYSKKFRHVSTRDVVDDFPRNINIRDSNFQSAKLNVHTAEETPLIFSDLNEFGEIDVFEDHFSGPPSPTNFSGHLDVDNTTDKAIERVLDELPDMLQEIDSFRNRECRKSHALTQQDADNISTGFKVKFQQSPRKDITSMTWKTEETRVMSYLADVLAEYNQPLENSVHLFAIDNKSERKLLFDCINCRLSDILNPPKGIRSWYKHKCVQLDQEIIKKELLDLLTNQPKEVTRDSLEVTGRDTDWLEFDEQMEIVAKEIEDDLIDMLVEEILSIKP